MLGFKIKYRTVERGHPRKTILVPIHRPDGSPAHAPVTVVDDEALARVAREDDAPPSVH